MGAKAAPLAALAAVGAAYRTLVKQFRNDDPSTYLTDRKSTRKDVLAIFIEGETPKVDEEILKWQYPAHGAATAAGAIPGAKDRVYEATKKRSSYLSKILKSQPLIGPMPKGVGPARAALGLSRSFRKSFRSNFFSFSGSSNFTLDVAAQRKGGTEWGDIATDPMNWMGPAFASEWS